MKNKVILYCITEDSFDKDMVYVTIVEEKYWKKNGHLCDSYPKWMEILDNTFFEPNGILSAMESIWEVMLGYSGLNRYKDIEDLKAFLNSIPGMTYSKELEDFIKKV